MKDLTQETTVLQLDSEKIPVENFTFENLGLEVKVGKSDLKVLLKGISGGVKAGEMVAIMGG